MLKTDGVDVVFRMCLFSGPNLVALHHIPTCIKVPSVESCTSKCPAMEFPENVLIKKKRYCKQDKQETYGSSHEVIERDGEGHSKAIYNLIFSCITWLFLVVADSAFREYIHYIVLI